MFLNNLIQYEKKQSCIRNHGFTLIEVLIAMAIFAIGILGVAKMQISSINGNSSARKFTEAIIYAQSEIESLRLMSFANIKSGSTVTATGYSIVWTITSYSDLNNDGQNDMDFDGDGQNDMIAINVVVRDPSGRIRANFNFAKFVDI